MQTSRTATPIVTALVLLLAALTPAVADQGTGTVSSTVTVADQPEACLVVEIDAIDFGLLDFGDIETATETYQVTSCSDGEQDLYVSGTDAVSDDQSVTWNLESSRGHNAFALNAEMPDFIHEVQITPTPAYFTNLVPGAGLGEPVHHTLRMPTAGSDGGGLTMSFDIVWTAAVQ